MPSSLRFTHPNSTTPLPTPSTALISSPSSEHDHIAETPAVAATRNLRVLSRVPMPGMHNSVYSSDANRTHIHLTTTKSLDLDPIDNIEFDDIAVREDDIPPNPDDEDELPSLHHPLQSLHNRPPSPPQFRDFGLPTLQTRRPEDLIPPTGLLGTLPDSIARGNEVPFRDTAALGLGRRIPERPHPLPLPGRNGNGRQPT